jgi:hypothetical protein
MLPDKPLSVHALLPKQHGDSESAAFVENSMYWRETGPLEDPFNTV